jgi:hypothetical protein
LQKEILKCYLLTISIEAQESEKN